MGTDMNNLTGIENPSVRAKPALALLLAVWLWPLSIVALVVGDACTQRHLEDHLLIGILVAPVLAILGVIPAYIAYRVGIGRRRAIAGVALSLNCGLGTLGLLILVLAFLL
jgi:hypothetical protein